MKKNNNVFWIGMNSFFTDLSSEMIKPLLPIYLKVVLLTPEWVITLFNAVSEFLASVFKIIFWLKTDNDLDKKKYILIWYAFSNALKPLMFIIQSLYWLFLVELMNRIWKGIRSAPKEALMTYSIEWNKLWKWFWFQKAMDSLGAFLWTLVISLILFIFWLDYSLHLGNFTINLFYIIAFITIIPWFISFLIIKKKVKNVKVDDDIIENHKLKKRKKLTINFNEIFKLGNSFNKLMVFAFLFSIGNLAVVFFILELINANFLAYQITLFYSVYSLVDSIFSYKVWKMSDYKNTNFKIIMSSLAVVTLSLFLITFVGIEKTVFGVFIWILVFWLLWLFEAAFEWTFKKIIVENIDKSKVGTWLWTYLGVTGFVKIVTGLVFGYAWYKGQTDEVFLLWFIFLVLSSLYFTFIAKNKEIKI